MAARTATPERRHFGSGRCARRPGRFPGAHDIVRRGVQGALGPVVRAGDDRWADVVRWTLNAVILAEELGVTQENVEAQAKDARDPRIRRLLGAEGDFGAMLGLSKTGRRTQFPQSATMAKSSIGTWLSIAARPGPRIERTVERSAARLDLWIADPLSATTCIVFWGTDD